jgi:hypothetical protein
LITPYFEKTVGLGGLCGFHRIGFSTASSTLAYRVCKFVVSVLKSPLDLNEAYEIVYHVLSSNHFLSRLLGGTVGPDFVLFCFKSYPIGGLKAYAGQKKNPNPVLVD